MGLALRNSTCAALLLLGAGTAAVSAQTGERAAAPAARGVVASLYGQQGTADIPLRVRVVYDVNNNGTLDPGDIPLPQSRVAMVALSEQGAETGPVQNQTAGEDGEVAGISVTPGTYSLSAVGPTSLPSDAGAAVQICRGWRDSFVVGAPLAKSVAQPAGGFGFVVDLIPDATGAVPTITVGVSDKAAPDSASPGAQITCPNPGTELGSLPSTGTGGGEGTAAPTWLGIIGLTLLAGVTCFTLWRARAR